MNGSSVTLDKVSIQIEASAKQASSNIEELTTTLSQLRSAVKGGFSNLSKLAASLEELKSASKNLGELEQNLSSLSNVQSALQSLSTIANPKGLDKTIKNLEKLPAVMNGMQPSTIANVARVSNELSAALSPLADKMGKIGAGFSAMAKMASHYNVKANETVRYVNNAGNSLKIYSKIMSSMDKGYRSLQKQQETFAKNITRNASNVISKIKQIGLSLLGTRTIFTATRKAVSEYMAMDAELTWKITNNWRALGAQLAPLIENVIWLFKQFIRVIYSVILALTGIDLIARANEKAMKGWGKAAKDTLGNLQKFDDLNVVEFPKGSGNDDNKLIELDTIDLTPIQKIIDWVRKMRDEIKEAWNSGQWEGVGKVLAEGLNGALAAVDFDWIEEKFKGIAEKFGDFLHGAVDNFDWSLFGEKLTRQLSLIPRLITTLLSNIPWEGIGEGLGKALASFDFDFWITSIFDAIGAFVTGLQTALLKIDGKLIGEKISQGVISILSNIGNLISKIDWAALGSTIHDVIVNIDWKGIWDSVVNLLKEAFNGLDDFFENIFGVDSGAWDALKAAVIGVGAAFATYKIVESFLAIQKILSSGAILEFLSGMAVPLGYLIAIGIAVAGIYVIIQGIKDILEGDIWKGIEKILIGISVVLLGIALAIGSIPVLIAAAVALVVAGIVWLVHQIVEHWDEIKEAFTNLWKNITEIWDKIKNGVKDAFSKMKTSAKDGLDGIKNRFNEFGDNIKKWWTERWNKIKQIPSNLKTLVNDAVNNVKKSFEGLSKFFGDFWAALKGGPKSFFNFLMEKYEWLLNKIISGVNWLIRQLNKFKFNVPDWVPGIGGKEMGFNIKEFGTISLPRLDIGTNNIPEDGPYYLHANEAVVPKKYNPALGGGTNEETNRRLDVLIDAITNMETTNIVNIGNEQLYRQQQRYVRRQNDKYGTDVNL